MAPLTRAQAPLELFGLLPELSQRILAEVMVGMSAERPDWYQVLASVNKHTKRGVDRLLRDPSVLANVTLWDLNLLRHPNAGKQQRAFLDKFTDDGFSRLEGMRLRLTFCNSSGGHCLWRMVKGRTTSRVPALKFMRLDAMGHGLFFQSFLHVSVNQLAHLTVTGVSAFPPMAPVLGQFPEVFAGRAPTKLTLLFTSAPACLQFVSGDAAGLLHESGCQELEIGPACLPNLETYVSQAREDCRDLSVYAAAN